MNLKVYLVAGLLLALAASAATMAQTDPPPATEPPPADASGSVPPDAASAPADATSGAPPDAIVGVPDPNMAVVHVIAENVETAPGLRGRCRQGADVGDRGPVTVGEGRCT